MLRFMEEIYLVFQKCSEKNSTTNLGLKKAKLLILIEKLLNIIVTTICH